MEPDEIFQTFALQLPNNSACDDPDLTSKCLPN